MKQFESDRVCSEHFVDGEPIKRSLRSISSSNELLQPRSEFLVVITLDFTFDFQTEISLVFLLHVARL